MRASRTSRRLLSFPLCAVFLLLGCASAPVQDPLDSLAPSRGGEPVLVRVAAVENATGWRPEAFRADRVGLGACHMLEEALDDTGRFRLAKGAEDRAKLDAFRARQWAMAEAGLLSSADAAKQGVETGARWSAVGRFTRCRFDQVGVLVGLVGLGRWSTTLGFELEIVDVASGATIVRSNGEAVERSLHGGIPVAELGGPFDQTSIGRAARRAIRMAVRNAVWELGL